MRSVTTPVSLTNSISQDAFQSPAHMTVLCSGVFPTVRLRAFFRFPHRVCCHRNAMCGKLQCSNVQAKTVFGIEPSIISTPIAGGKCYGVDFMLGSDVPDPGMVNEGTKCGENKVRRREEGRGRGGNNEVLKLVSSSAQVCVNFECRGADVLSYDCDVHTKCHGHGVSRLSSCLPVCQVSHMTQCHLSVCRRCATATGTATATTAGLRLSASYRVTVEALTADPRGTVCHLETSDLPEGSRVNALLCVPLPQIRTRLSGTACSSSSSSSSRCSRSASSFSCTGTSCCGDSG